MVVKTLRWIGVAVLMVTVYLAVLIVFGAEDWKL